MAAGDRYGARGFRAVYAVSNAGVWKLHTLPQPRSAGGTQILGVSCASPTDCVAVGAVLGPADRVLRDVLERFDGRGWQEVPLADSKTVGLEAVSCMTTGVCVATGGTRARMGRSIVVKLDGGRVVNEQHLGPAAGALSSVSCWHGGCVAAGASNAEDPAKSHGIAYRWDGGAWQPIAVPALPSSSVSSISCATAVSCTLVEAYGRSRSRVWRLEGHRLVPVAVLGPRGGSLSEVACATARTCVFAGTVQRRPSAAVTPSFTEVADAGHWGEAPVPGARAAGPSALACPSARTCVLVGTYGSGSSVADVPLIDVLHGGRWQRAKMAPPVR